ncbi:MAG: serine hydrolase domain-containing protein [Hyphomonadaceae bacterium]
MNRRSLLIGAGGLALSACATTPPASSLPLSDELDALVARGMEQLRVVPGFALAVYSRDGVYARGFGVTDVTTGERADADTAFYIASATKPLTALALLRKAERGEIDLDQAIAAFAPDAPFPAAARAAEVTFRQLLTHTSGIENDPIAFRVAFSGQHDPATLWRLLAASGVNSDAPLGRFDYTNTGYNITTLLTDRRFGVAWQDMLQSEVFGPVGMTHASARMSRATANGWGMAKPHASLPEGLTKLYLEKTDATMHSAGGVIMSANDALRWLELMAEGGAVGGRRVVSEASIESARAPVAAIAEGTEFAGYSRAAYGLGWYLGPYRDELLFHHFGGFAGARAHVSHIPTRRIGVAAFVNENTAAAQFSDAVANYVYDRTAGRADAAEAFNAKLAALAARRDQINERLRADRTSRAARPWTLTRPRAVYAGAYEHPNFGRIEVSAAGEDLDVGFGALRARATAANAPDAIRVELVPGSGELVGFSGPETAPDALHYNGETYTRV